MSETLITEGENTQAADPQQAAATQPEGQQAQGGEQAANTQQAAEGTQQAGDKEIKPDAAPEKYEFAAPEGVQFDDAVIGAFSEVAKELNLPQDKAQKVLDKVSPVLAARQAEQFAAVQESWAAQSKADKEFGGEKLTENLSVAKKALETFGTPELRQLLNDSGIGNHPEVVRLFYRAGKAISEDRFVSGQGASHSPADPRKLYAASNMNP